MATLAQGAQVRAVAIRNVVIEVRDLDIDHGARDRVKPFMQGAAILAFVPGGLSNLSPYLGPIGRVLRPLEFPTLPAGEV
jgi:hypothetical protein